MFFPAAAGYDRRERDVARIVRSPQARMYALTHPKREIHGGRYDVRVAVSGCAVTLQVYRGHIPPDDMGVNMYTESTG